MTAVPGALRWRLGLTAVAFAAGAAAAAAGGAAVADAATAAAWLAAAAVPLGYPVWALGRSLALNRPPEDAAVGDGGARVYPTLGLANGLTLVRGWLYGAVAGFLVVVPPVGSAWRWLPALAYGLGAAVDRLDGFVARGAGRRTALGARLDLAFDTMGFLVAPLVAVAWGRLPAWYLSLSAARYVYRLACWTRERRGLPVGELPDSAVRRPLAGVQMAFITVALVPVVPPGPLRVGAAAVLVPSLSVFLRDYLLVAGHLGKANRNESPGD